ncbi:MAG: glycerol-3-phosphate dehydrogenase [Planctomycetaceae bacterium]
MKPVLILGAGINGAAVARELAINGVPVCIVDTGDVAGGATSRSSRLIHGGLRYLEYRDTTLVRESLIERERLLKLAPHFVKPLRLTIPVEHRFGGLWGGFVRFSGLARTSLGQELLKFGRGPRGLIAIKAGLTMYDRLARSDKMPPHKVESFAAGTSGSTSSVSSVAPQVSQRFRWLCSYSDAQIEFPERFVLAMLEDARRAAEANDTMFEILPYHKAVASESSAEISIVPVDDDRSTGNTDQQKTITPSVVINATGAWGDRTLEALGLKERPLFAGTKGSHLFTNHPPLVDAQNGNGIYAEADDGRLIFILPCAAGVLIGTTDEPFEGDPGNAVATPHDVDYLLQMVAGVFPDVGLTIDQVSMHHAGVRPLPKNDGGPTAAVPRGHSIEETTLNGVPILTLVGGKLTTCRSLAEEVSHRVCGHQNHPQSHSTIDRPLPGAPAVGDHFLTEEQLSRLAEDYNLTTKQAAAVWPLIGNRFDEVFTTENNDSLAGTDIPQSFVRWSIKHEWCTKLEDLVERRLMLIFQPTIHRATLEQLAIELVRAGRLAECEVDAEVDKVCRRLSKFYGRTVASD